MHDTLVFLLKAKQNKSERQKTPLLVPHLRTINRLRILILTKRNQRTSLSLFLVSLSLSTFCGFLVDFVFMFFFSSWYLLMTAGWGSVCECLHAIGSPFSRSVVHIRNADLSFFGFFLLLVFVVAVGSLRRRNRCVFFLFLYIFGGRKETHEMSKNDL